MSDQNVSSWSLVRFSLIALTIICVWWLLKRAMCCTVGCVTTYGSSFEGEKVDLCRWRLAFFRYLTKFEAMVVASDCCTAVWRVAQLSWVLSAHVTLILLAEWERKRVCRIVKKAWKRGCSLLPYCFLLSLTFSFRWTITCDWTRALRDCCEKPLW